MIQPGHQDYDLLVLIRDGILSRIGGSERLNETLPPLIKDAVDFVLDPVRTARTRIDDLDKVEKTFIGLKIEHYLRDLLDVPRGVRRDLVIDGIDVDVKNTVSFAWMIPPETYRHNEPCLLIATTKADNRCWLGLLVAREAYLNAGNRDQKRSVSEFGRRHILWLVPGVPYPPSRWIEIDMARFRELRRIKGGTKRAAQFFRENIGVRVHRSILQALLFDQLDFMKRFRENGGARDLLRKEDIVLLSGAWKAAKEKEVALGRDEFLAIKSCLSWPTG